MKRYTLVDTTKNHNKFWAITDAIHIGRTPRGSWQVSCHWGRIGTAGSRRDFFFLAQELAEEFRLKKILSKEAKGYQLDRQFRTGTGAPHTVSPPYRSRPGSGGSLTIRAGTGAPLSTEPHTVSPPMTEREILASDNKSLRKAYLENLPPLDPDDPFGLPFDD